MPLAPFLIKSSNHGRGVFATHDIAAGEVIYRVPVARYELISYQELLRKRVTDNPLQISPRRYLDWGAPGVLFNHACEPNVGLTAYPHLIFIALRAIKAGEELRWDYSTCIDRDTECDFDCGCGAKTCRGRTGGFFWLSKKTKECYRKLGIMQMYLLNEK